MRWYKVKAIILTAVIQVCICALVFFGFLLDPLIGVWIVSIYFFGVGSFLTFHALLRLFQRAMKKPDTLTS